MEFPRSAQVAEKSFGLSVERGGSYVLARTGLEPRRLHVGRKTVLE